MPASACVCARSLEPLAPRGPGRAPARTSAADPPSQPTRLRPHQDPEAHHAATDKLSGRPHRPLGPRVCRMPTPRLRPSRPTAEARTPPMAARPPCRSRRPAARRLQPRARRRALPASPRSRWRAARSAWSPSATAARPLGDSGSGSAPCPPREPGPLPRPARPPRPPQPSSAPAARAGCGLQRRSPTTHHPIGPALAPPSNPVCACGWRGPFRRRGRGAARGAA